jgi:hypothetical protein
MAVGDRLAFYKTKVNFNGTDMKVSSLSLNEQASTEDVTTTEDGGYAFQLATLSKIDGTFKTWHRENTAPLVSVRQTGNLTWNVGGNTSNVSLTGNWTVPIQITGVSKGDASVSGAVPLTVTFVGQGGYVTGSYA